MLQLLQQSINNINNNIEGLEARLTRRMKASACNEIARIQNSTRNMAPCFELSSGLVDQEEKVSPLVPLLHAVTGDAINSFPATVAALNGLQGASAKAILRALEEPETGAVAECRTRFMIAIGAVIQAL